MIDFKPFFILVILFFLGCQTVKPLDNAVWNLPPKPIKYPVHFEVKNQDLYLDKVNSENLSKNIDELDKYILKMEALVKEMKKYYNAK